MLRSDGDEAAVARRSDAERTARARSLVQERSQADASDFPGSVDDRVRFYRATQSYITQLLSMNVVRGRLERALLVTFPMWTLHVRGSFILAFAFAFGAGGCGPIDADYVATDRRRFPLASEDAPATKAVRASGAYDLGCSYEQVAVRFVARNMFAEGCGRRAVYVLDGLQVVLTGVVPLVPTSATTVR